MRLILILLIVGLHETAIPLLAQRAAPPLEIADVGGEWILDEAATPGLRANGGSAGGVVDVIGFRAARRLVVTVTTTAIAVSVDGGAPSSFQFDGIERRQHDERTQVELDIAHRFTFVAGMPALTTTRLLPDADAGRQGKATIVTDAYRAEAGTLTVERQHSVLGHDGTLLPLANSPRRSTLVYKRASK